MICKSDTLTLTAWPCTSYLFACFTMTSTRFSYSCPSPSVHQSTMLPVMWGTEKNNQRRGEVNRRAKGYMRNDFECWYLSSRIFCLYRRSHAESGATKQHLVNNSSIEKELNKRVMSLPSSHGQSLPPLNQSLQHRRHLCQRRGAAKWPLETQSR